MFRPKRRTCWETDLIFFNKTSPFCSCLKDLEVPFYTAFRSSSSSFRLSSPSSHRRLFIKKTALFWQKQRAATAGREQCVWFTLSTGSLTTENISFRSDYTINLWHFYSHHRAACRGWQLHSSAQCFCLCTLFSCVLWPWWKAVVETSKVRKTI